MKRYRQQVKQQRVNAPGELLLCNCRALEFVAAVQLVQCGLREKLQAIHAREKERKVNRKAADAAVAQKVAAAAATQKAAAAVAAEAKLMQGAASAAAPSAPRASAGLSHSAGLLRRLHGLLRPSAEPQRKLTPHEERMQVLRAEQTQDRAQVERELAATRAGAVDVQRQQAARAEMQLAEVAKQADATLAARSRGS